MRKHSNGCLCHPQWMHAHDNHESQPYIYRYKASPRIVGSGIANNRNHDRELAKEIKIWREQIELAGGRIVAEYNTNDLLRILGEQLHGPVSQVDKNQTAIGLGFDVYEGRIQVPDHRMIIEWPDGRKETKDFEHINPLTYNSRQIVAKLSSSNHVSGIRVPSPSQHGMGRRVKDGPDVLAILSQK